MRQLVLLYWGCVFLMYLSQTYCPVETQLNSRQTGKRHFMLRRADVFMVATILWLTCFSFLRTSYNDTYNYIYAFQNSESLAEGFQKGIFTDLTGNPLSELYESVMRSITSNYHVYFLIPALLSSFAVINLFKKYSVGDVSVHQTDNIIVSTFVSTKTVGLLSNYNLLISTVSSCINVLFNSVTGSLGNMVATESKEYQYAVFKKYRFIGFWFYGFTATALGILMTPFITLWIGGRMVVDTVVVNLLVIDYYMIGQRICLNNIKSAAGIYEPDKYVALLQAIVNLISSIALVKLIGLPGVYVGTLIQGTLSTILKPILSYKVMFGVSSRYYFIDSLKYGSAVIISYVICTIIKKFILSNVTIMRFIWMIPVVVIVPNTVFVLLFHKRPEFRFMVGTARRIVSQRFRKG